MEARSKIKNFGLPFSASEKTAFFQVAFRKRKEQGLRNLENQGVYFRK